MSHSERHQEKRRARAKQKAKECRMHRNAHGGARHYERPVTVPDLKVKFKKPSIWRRLGWWIRIMFRRLKRGRSKGNR
jgi:hypothetical protein